MLNVLYIATDPTLGGSTRSLFHLIEGIKDYVHPIVLFNSKYVAYDFFVQHGIECHIYPFIRLYALRENSLLDVYNRPWRWHVIKKPYRDYGCMRFVKKILKGRKIDIVHSNTSPIDIGVRLAKILNAKHVWHVREFCDLHFNMDIYQGLPRLRQMVNHADARIAISSAIKEHWQMTETNTWVIHNAIRSKSDTCFYPDKDKYLLFMSYWLTEMKGTRNAIIAFAKSEVAQKGYKLKLIGNITDDYKQSLIETINQHGIADNVEFIACQNDVKPFFAHATAFIMASQNEGLGRVTAEAMFFGCPVIAHATGGTLDIVKDRETGYLYNTLDELADKIKLICTTPQTEMILRAQSFAVDNLSQEVYGPQIIEVYNKVCHKLQ